MVNPAIFIVHGAWISSVSKHALRCFCRLAYTGHQWAFYPLASNLWAQNYPVVALELPTSYGDPTQTAESDIAFIRQNVGQLSDQGYDSIILMHSYGGPVGGAAFQGLTKQERSANNQTGGIVGAIYAASLITQPEVVGSNFSVIQSGYNPAAWYSAQDLNATDTTFVDSFCFVSRLVCFRLTLIF